MTFTTTPGDTTVYPTFPFDDDAAIELSESFDGDDDELIAELEELQS